MLLSPIPNLCLRCQSILYRMLWKYPFYSYTETCWLLPFIPWHLWNLSFLVQFIEGCLFPYESTCYFLRRFSWLHQTIYRLAQQCVRVTHVFTCKASSWVPPRGDLHSGEAGGKERALFFSSSKVDSWAAISAWIFCHITKAGKYTLQNCLQREKRKLSHHQPEVNLLCKT